MVLLVHRLAGDPERLGDLLPRPADRPCIVNVQLLELLDQIAQRRYRGKADGGIAAVNCLVQSSQLAHAVSLG